MGADLPAWIIAAAAGLCGAIGALFFALSKAWADRVADSQRASDRTMELATAGQATLSALAEAIKDMKSELVEVKGEQRRTTEALRSCNTSRREG